MADVLGVSDGEGVSDAETLAEMDVLAVNEPVSVGVVVTTAVTDALTEMLTVRLALVLWLAVVEGDSEVLAVTDEDAATDAVTDVDEVTLGCEEARAARGVRGGAAATAGGLVADGARARSLSLARVHAPSRSHSACRWPSASSRA